MLKHVKDLMSVVHQTQPKRMAVVFAHDAHVIEAIASCLPYTTLHPILIGDEPVIRQLISDYPLLNDVSIIHETDPESATKIAMDLVNKNEADIVMKGLIDTKYLLKGVVNREYGIRQQPLLSHVGLVSFPLYDHLIIATDGAMNITPNPDEMVQIIENAVRVAHGLGIKKPKVGLVSAVEKPNEKIASTMMAEAVKAHYQQVDAGSFYIDGPFAVDNLVSEESVKSKGITSPVAGSADILVFPNLDGGNIFYKTAVFLAKGASAGLVVGAKVPIVLTSRADSAEAKQYSIMLAVVIQDGLLAADH
ncbi:MAG: phosphate acyltransferase, partial [Candidatus Izemoplasmatales bacterium]|nr:phosphate acyltransferase [Candidatus Izemoplasmatales bacterium]